MTIDVKHGWFSKKQFKQNKVIYYYKDVMGKEVALTEIKNCTDNSMHYSCNTHSKNLVHSTWYIGWSPLCITIYTSTLDPEFRTGSYFDAHSKRMV